MELHEEGTRVLAAQVLKQDVRDNDFTDRDALSFWCEVVDVAPEAFFERAVALKEAKA